MKLWFRFPLALVAGAIGIVLAINVCVMVPGLGVAAFDYRSRSAMLAMLMISFSIGGGVSGAVLAGGIRARRRKFLYLAAASPASVAWVWTIASLLCGMELDRSDMLAFFVACLSAWAGSLLMYWLFVSIGRTANLSRKSEDPGDREGAPRP